MGLLRPLAAGFATTLAITVGVSAACQTGLHHPAPHVAQGVTVALLGSALALTGGLAYAVLERVPAALGFGSRRR